MPKKFTYQTVLISGPASGTYAEFPFDSLKEFGTNKHVWSKVTLDGKIYSMNLLPNGKGGHWLRLKKEICNAIGKYEGDTVSIELEKDNKPLQIEIPEYLQWLLDNDQQMTQYFEKLPFSGKKFWIGFIQETKNDDTKVHRINQLFEYLHRHYAHKT